MKRSRGERTGDVPFGHSLAEDGVHLVEVEEEQATIREVRNLAGQGLTLRAICERLASMGLRPRSGAWHSTKVARILRRDALGGGINACSRPGTVEAGYPPRQPVVPNANLRLLR